MVVFKICLFIDQHLICKILKKKIMNTSFPLGNQKGYIHLNFYHYTIFHLSKCFDQRIRLQFNKLVLVGEKTIM